MVVVGEKNKKSMDSFPLKKFIGVYVNCALDKLKSSPTADDFEREVQKEISNILNIDFGLAKKLYDPFHWELFCRNGDLAEYVQPSEYGKEPFVRLKRDYNYSDVLKMEMDIVRKYNEYLKTNYDAYFKLKRDEAKKFLYEVGIVKVYNSKGCAGLDSFVENYDGNNKKYLNKVMDYINKRNSRANSRLFGIGDLDLELILDETIK